MFRWAFLSLLSLSAVTAAPTDGLLSGLTGVITSVNLVTSGLTSGNDCKVAFYGTHNLNPVDQLGPAVTNIPVGKTICVPVPDTADTVNQISDKLKITPITNLYNVAIGGTGATIVVGEAEITCYEISTCDSPETPPTITINTNVVSSVAEYNGKVQGINIHCIKGPSPL
ncbi:hypothetical protein HDV00_006795 [Rhizophlyctis rosea]|nr:hypothetical protein HDV00_006795 [Rhizophlyctis rosea]